jgi:hypothetical protein
LQKGEELRKRVQGFDSEDSSEDDGGILQLDQIEKEVVDDGGEKKGVFGMKFMQRGMEKQRLEVLESVEEAKKELQDFERFGSDSDSGSDEESEEETSGRRVFGVQSQEKKKLIDTEKPKKKAFEVKASGPVVVQAPLFQVESFEDPDAKVIPKVEPERPKAKPHVQKPVEEEQDVNPWLKEDVAVKKSISVHKLYEKNSKDGKSLAKISNVKKQSLAADQSDDDDIIQTTKIAVSESEDENIEEAGMVHVKDVKNLDSKTVMQMAFVNDSIAQVLMNNIGFCE